MYRIKEGIGDKYIISKGQGYWEIDIYPIGGSFRRAAEDIPVTLIEYLSAPYKGVDAKFKTDDGRMVAANSNDLMRKMKEFDDSLDKALHKVIWKTLEMKQFSEDYSMATSIKVALLNNFDIQIKDRNYLHNY